MNGEAVCYQCATDEEKHRMIYHAKDGVAQCSRCGRPFQVSVLQGPTDDLVGRVAPAPQYTRADVVAMVRLWRLWPFDPWVWWGRLICWAAGGHQVRRFHGWNWCRRCARVAPEEGAPVDGWEPNGGNLYRPHRLMVGQGKFWRCAHGNTGITMGPEPQFAVMWNDCERCAEADPAARAEWIAGHMNHTKEGK